MWRRWAFLLVLCATGCAEFDKKPPEPAAEIAAEPAQPEALVTTEPKFKNSTLKYLNNRKLKPQPTRPLNVRSKCSHRDAVGTATQLDLLVKEAEVKTFTAQVAIKGYGTCNFKLGDFERQATRLMRVNAIVRAGGKNAAGLTSAQAGARLSGAHVGAG